MPRTSSACPAASAATSPAPAASAPPADGRDFAGRFAKYNPGGPGNPFARRAAALRQAFQRSVSPRGMRALGRALHKRALAGDHVAAKLLLAYGGGRPAPASDPDKLDEHEMGVLGAGAGGSRLLLEAAQAVLPQAVCELARVVLPALSAARWQEFATKLRAEPAPPAAPRQQEDDADEEEGYQEEEDDDGEAEFRRLVGDDPG